MELVNFKLPIREIKGLKLVANSSIFLTSTCQLKLCWNFSAVFMQTRLAFHFNIAFMVRIMFDLL